MKIERLPNIALALIPYLEASQKVSHRYTWSAVENCAVLRPPCYYEHHAIQDT